MSKLKVLATVPLGTGVAREIKDLFDVTIRWTPDAEYDAILFEGGADIHPSLYNSPNTHSHVGDKPSRRDEIEVEAMKHAIDKKALIIGVCRGAQLACALAGGKLVQHADYHGNSHWVMANDTEAFKVSSVHHQQMYPWDVDHELLAWAEEGDTHLGHDIDNNLALVEPEAVYFPNINALAFQWHPEWASSNEELDFTINKIKEKL